MFKKNLHYVFIIFNFGERVNLVTEKTFKNISLYLIFNFDQLSVMNVKEKILFNFFNFIAIFE